MHRYKLLLSSTLIMGILATLCLATFSSSKAYAISGSQFKAGRIIDDSLFYKSSDMAASQIQTFLNSKVPSCDTNGTKPSGHSGYPTRAAWGRHNGYAPPYTCLKNYKANTPAVNAESGICGYLSAKSNRTAAQIVDDVSKACGINPKIMIVLMQKEQGLVTDDWPWSYEYKFATGFCVYDTTPPPSCAGTDGFFKQIYYAARQFKKYKADQTYYNFVAGSNNLIPWNPDSSCGKGAVFIQNQATAGLYNYTPYQPNQAALNAGYGTGNGCSSYGNRNFWLYFNDWFGPTLLDIVRAKSDSGDPTQYVIYDGKKLGIPSNDVLKAWGIDNLPLQTYSASALSNIPSQGVLSRFAKSTKTGRNYFIDNESYFYGGNSAIRSAWGFSGTVSVGTKLFSLLNNKGSLSPYFIVSGANTINAIDGTKYLPFSTPDSFAAWRKSESILTISTDYYGKLTSGDVISHNRISSGGNDYVVVDGKKLKIPSGLVSSYPYSGSNITVSSKLLGYLYSSGDLKRFIRSSYNGTIYLLNNGTLHGIPSTSLWDTYAGKGSKAYSDLGKAPFDLVPKSSTLRSTIVKRPSDSSYYVLDKVKAHPISASLQDNYSASSIAFTLDNYSFSSLDTTGSPATQFVTSSKNPAVFLLDGGKRLGISNPTTLRQLKDPNTPVTQLTDYDLLGFTYIKNIANYLGTSSQRYFIDQGVKHTALPEVAQEWGLNNSAYTVVDDGTIADFSLGSSTLGRTAKIGNKTYLVSSGKRYEIKGAYFSLWGLPTSGNISLSSDSFFRVGNGGNLNRFAYKDGGIYTVDAGKLIGIPNLDSLFNIGFSGQPIVHLSDSTFTAMGGTSTGFNGYLVKDSTNTCYIMDKGSKRSPSSASSSDWCYDSSNATLLSNAYLSMLPSDGQLTRSFRSNDDNTLFAIDNGTKRWIPSNQIYYQHFQPFSEASKYLKNVLPTGPKINPNGS